MSCLFSFDFDGGRTRARTLDPLIKSQLLYQLSYAPIEIAGPRARRGQAFSKGAVGCPALTGPDLRLRVTPGKTAGGASVALLVDQLVLADPGHHRAQLCADLLDRMGVGARAHRLERGLIDLVLEHPVAREPP